MLLYGSPRITPASLTVLSSNHHPVYSAACIASDSLANWQLSVSLLPVAGCQVLHRRPRTLMALDLCVCVPAHRRGLKGDFFFFLDGRRGGENASRIWLYGRDSICCLHGDDIPFIPGEKFDVSLARLAVNIGWSLLKIPI